MELFYRKLGNGPPLIILPGLLGVTEHWLPFAKVLSSYFEVYILDHRNQGNSPHSDVFNYHVLYLDLEEFITSYELKNPIIIGHSMGGKVCIEYLKHNNIIKKAIIIDICHKEYPIYYSIYSLFQVMMSNDLAKTNSYKNVEILIRNIEKNNDNISLLLKNVGKKGNKYYWKPNVNIIFKNIEFIRKAIEINQNISIPTLFIKGEKSDFIKNEDFELIYSSFPSAKITIVKNAGHWVQKDNFNDLIVEIKKFIF